MIDNLSSTDKILLKFVLNAEVHDWREWAAGTDIDEHSSFAYQLFPSAYKNLERTGEQHPWRGRLKGVYRRQWTQNKIHTAHYLKTVQLLGDAGIESILPFDQQISLLLDDSAVYPLREPRITIPWRSARKAIGVLTGSSWKISTAHLTRTRLRDKLACSDWRLIDVAGNTIWLTDHYHKGHRGPNADADLWSRAHPGKISGTNEVGITDLMYAAATENIHSPNSIVWVVAMAALIKKLNTHHDLKSVPVAGPGVSKLIRKRLKILEEFMACELPLEQVSEYLVQPTLLMDNRAFDIPSPIRKMVFVYQLLNRWSGVIGLRGYLRQMNSAQIKSVQ